MKLIKEIHKKESGQAFILVLILLVVGGLIIAPLLGYMSTGLMASQTHEQKMDEVYAADAGIEDAMWKILNGDFESLGVNDESDPYTLTDVNGLPVTVTVTKLSLLESLISDDQYNENAPHGDWVYFNVEDPGGGVLGDTGEPDFRPYVEYTGDIMFYYDGPGNRTLESAGAYFSPPPGDTNDINNPDLPDYTYFDPPYEITVDGVPISMGSGGVITFDDLQVGSPGTKIVPGGFAFIWRWEHNRGPEFDQDNRGGAFSFKLRIYDETDWEYSTFFVWATFKEQDIAYITSRDYFRWLIEATADGTTVRSVVVAQTGTADILTWEINPPEE